MLLNVLTPTNKLVSNLEVDEVIVPAHSGELDILPGHAPLMSTLEMGIVKYKVGGEEKKIVISWGYLEVNPKSVNILSETAEEPSKIDLTRAAKAISESERMLASGDITLADMDKYMRKLRRAQLRKEAAEQA